MTDTSTLVPDAAPDATPGTEASQPKTPSNFKKRAEAVQPVLEKLFTLYPRLFGAEFVPLKLGIFQELLAAHPGVLEKDSLKIALSVHTRSTRYLHSVAAGMQRHDLAGQPVDSLAPEHVVFALLELHRRKLMRTPPELLAKLQKQLRGQLMHVFETSGLERADFMARVHTNDEQNNALVEHALAQHGEVVAVAVAKDAALLSAYDASGKTPTEFADMYGMKLRDVTAALERRG
jgi:sRNA-binding protein